LAEISSSPTITKVVDEFRVLTAIRGEEYHYSSSGAGYSEISEEGFGAKNTKKILNLTVYNNINGNE